MSSSRYACSQCHQLVTFDWTTLKEDDWKEFQTSLAEASDTSHVISATDASLSAASDSGTTASGGLPLIDSEEKTRVLDASFVFVTDSIKDQITSDVVASVVSAEMESALSGEVAALRGASDTTATGGDTMTAALSDGGSMKKEFNILDSIFAMATGMAQVSHPLCSVCTEKLIAHLDSELEELNTEKRAYKSVLARFEESPEPESSRGVLTTRVRRKDHSQTRETRILSETRKLELELAEIRKERQRLDADCSELAMEASMCDALERDYLMDANDFRYAIENLSSQHAAVREKMREVSFHLDSMKRTNVFDDAFHISYAGHFGTINGLRLGKLPVATVEWDEINAGLGQCLLLLDVLTKRCSEFVLKKYELIPLGSYSCIREKKRSRAKKTAAVLKHELYGSSRLLGSKQCDSALVCLLDCVQQFAKWISHKKDSSFALRYAIELPDFIGDTTRKRMLSIKLQLNQDEKWTQALKFMLVDLKCLLAWVARFNP